MTHDRGGAARAALRLHNSLLTVGLESLVLVQRKTSRDQTIQEWAPRSSFTERVQRRLRQEYLDRLKASYRKTREPWDVFSDDRSRIGGQLAATLNAFDVIHWHWIAGFVDIGKILSRLKKPVIWTLHDESAVTGGCHYDHECSRWQIGCGRCPQLGSNSKSDMSSRSWRRKRAIFEEAGANLQIVAPSKWLSEYASRSVFFRNTRISEIPNGIDCRRFVPNCRMEMRRLLGIRDHQKAILFIAAAQTHRRKGAAVLQKALARTPLLEGCEVVLLSVGSGAGFEGCGVPFIDLGRLERDELLAGVYAAADVFVIPSLQDNLPNTVLEALACGTPVIGSDTGGIPDMVRPGETGWLFETGNAEALRATLQEALATRDLTGLRTRCREVAEREYSLELQAERYKKLYEEVAGRAYGDSGR